VSETLALRIRPGLECVEGEDGVKRYRPICHVFGPGPDEFQAYEGAFVESEDKAEALAKELSATLRAQFAAKLRPSR
jgi:hypothetical protein